MASADPDRIPNDEMPPVTGAFRGGLFRLSPGPDLQAQGPVVWAVRQREEATPSGHTSVAGALRTVRIVPWLAPGLDEPAITALVNCIASGRSLPVIEADADDDYTRSLFA